MEDYNKLKVVELKDLLKERGIPSTGLSRKQQIVEALEASDAELKDGETGADATTHVTPGAADASEGGRDADAEQDVANGDSGNGEEAPPETIALTSEATITADNPTEGASAPEAPFGNPVDALAGQSAPEVDTTQTPTPIPASPSSITSEAKKRKRRSPTPTLSASSVTKKLKTAEEDVVKLPEDTVMDDATTPAVLENGQDGIVQQVQAGNADPPSIATEAPRASEDASELARALSPGPEPMSDVGMSDPPARHPTTAALYIRNLVRPLQPQQLRDYLLDLASPRGAQLDDALIKKLHLDSLRTHAFVVFDSEAAAVRVRSSLHDRIWPDEPARKALWVDYVPEASVQTWIEMENSHGGNKNGPRWEVHYTDLPDGVSATLHDVHSSAAPAGPQPSISSDIPGPGMPNAPTGPRGSRRPSPPPLRDSELELEREAPAANTETFGVLDERFSFTSTKPKLYYLPVDSQLAARRLDELDDLTSRDWDPKRHGSFSHAEGTQRRYTFEDGDRLVDGGTDIGNFGKPASSARRGRGRGMR